MKNKCCCVPCKIVGLIVAIGAINWGLVGAFNTNLVSQLAGVGTTAEKIIYIVVGIAGVIKLLSCVIKCPCCKSSCSTSEDKESKEKEGGCCGGH